MARIPLNWWKDFKMIQLITISDDLSYLHALAYAYYKPYRLGEINGEKLDRREFIETLYDELGNNISGEDISRILKKDVYILYDKKLLRKYLTNDATESIVLLQNGTHYDVLGLDVNGEIITSFSSESKFIKYIRTMI